MVISMLKDVVDLEPINVNVVNVNQMKVEVKEAQSNEVDLDNEIARTTLKYNVVNKAVEFNNANSENEGAYLAFIAGASYIAKCIIINGEFKPFHGEITLKND